MTLYAAPGTEDSIVDYRERYDNYIGGQWVAPVDGEYMDNISPVNGEVFCQVARGKEADINLAIDAAEKAFETFGKTTPAERALLLHRIADRIEENLEKIAVAETWENGKAVRETLAADIPLAVDHFRYFAGAIRAQEGGAVGAAVDIALQSRGQGDEPARGPDRPADRAIHARKARGHEPVLIADRLLDQPQGAAQPRGFQFHDGQRACRRIAQHQGQALVGGHPSGEADREDLRIEHRVGPAQLGISGAALLPRQRSR